MTLQKTLSRRQFAPSLDCYPEETLLRVRIAERTVLLKGLDKIEETIALLSPSGLEAVAMRYLEAKGFKIVKE